MSRVRFHAARAISNISDFIWSGPEWENWDGSLPARENISLIYKGLKPPDMVLCYRPEEILGFAEIPFPTVLNRDEMFTEEIPAERTMKRITENKIDCVISHQKKQLEHPLFRKLPTHFAYIPYCADTSIFKNYGQQKTIDVLLTGNLAPTRYPFRAKLYEYLLKMRKDPQFQERKIFSYPYPGYRLKQAFTDAHVIDYAKLINASKICLTCSGRFHLKYAKYVEIPACRSLLMADMPSEDQEVLKNYLIEISPEISYEDFCKKIVYYLDHEQERQEWTDRGYKIVYEQYSQERYAEMFVSVVREYLEKHGHEKLWK
jgi:hypothetical protein